MSGLRQPCLTTDSMCMGAVLPLANLTLVVMLEYSEAMTFLTLSESPWPSSARHATTSSPPRRLTSRIASCSTKQPSKLRNPFCELLNLPLAVPQVFSLLDRIAAKSFGSVLSREIGLQFLIWSTSPFDPHRWSSLYSPHCVE
ncbi:unnamed protein product [Arctia plantaginis]|uniref:Uncharacterized protein n=1 Tax=Arctia plantaginis TaxID=874455 RepID=A0A8S1BD24_ARCPL|nr:unnamed protein product [Arctia plantaginis]